MIGFPPAKRKGNRGTGAIALRPTSYDPPRFVFLLSFSVASRVLGDSLFARSRVNWHSLRISILSSVKNVAMASRENPVPYPRLMGMAHERDPPPSCTEDGPPGKSACHGCWGWRASPGGLPSGATVMTQPKCRCWKSEVTHAGELRENLRRMPIPKPCRRKCSNIEMPRAGSLEKVSQGGAPQCGGTGSEWKVPSQPVK